MALFVLTGPFVAREAWAVGLEEAVRAALQTNPDVGIVAENRRAVDFELRQARSGFYPSLDVRAAAGQEFTNDPGTRDRTTTAGGDNSVWLPRYESGVSVRQMLYDGNQTELQVARQEARTVSATRRVRETSEFIALDAIEAYIDSIRQRELVRIAEQNVQAHLRILELVEARERGGASTTADVQQTAARLATAQDRLTEAEAFLRDADAVYVRVIGESPRDLERPFPPVNALPASLNEAINLSLKNNPSISVSRADTQVAREDLSLTQSAFLPRFDLELDADSNRNIDGTRGQDTSFSALVVMRYNLFAGGRDINRRQEQIARLAEARQRQNRAVRLAEEEMRLSWNALISARERLVALRNEVEANERVNITYRQQFDLGGRDLIDLLDAENDVFVSRSNLISTEFLESFSVYRILATGGVLLSALDIPDLRDSDTELDPITPETVEPDVSRLQVEPGETEAPAAPVLPESAPALAPPQTPPAPAQPAPAPLESAPVGPEGPALTPQPSPVAPVLPQPLEESRLDAQPPAGVEPRPTGAAAGAGANGAVGIPEATGTAEDTGGPFLPVFPDSTNPPPPEEELELQSGEPQLQSRLEIELPDELREDSEIDFDVPAPPSSDDMEVAEDPPTRDLELSAGPDPLDLESTPAPRSVAGPEPAAAPSSDLPERPAGALIPAPESPPESSMKPAATAVEPDGPETLEPAAGPETAEFEGGADVADSLLVPFEPESMFPPPSDGAENWDLGIASRPESADPDVGPEEVGEPVAPFEPNPSAIQWQSDAPELLPPPPAPESRPAAPSQSASQNANRGSRTVNSLTTGRPSAGIWVLSGPGRAEPKKAEVPDPSEPDTTDIPLP